MAKNAGGGMRIYGEYDNVTISNCIVRDNFGSDGGGGIDVRAQDINVTIKNCEITGNLVGGGHGGGINCRFGNINILNSTIADNITDGTGGGVYSCGYSSTDLTVRNSIVWNNISSDGSEFRVADSSYSSLLQISYSDIMAGQSGVSVGDGGTLIWGLGNIDADPLFVNRYDDDYRLSIASACIDAGTDAGVYDDIEGNIRPFDLPGVDNNESEMEFDIGAYEVVAAEIDILVTPKRIKRNGRHRDIKVTVKLTEYEAEHIDGKFILFPGAITAKQQEVQDDEGELKVIAYFDSDKLLAAIPYKGMVELTVVGKFEPNRYFYGNGNIKIIQR
jgi:hypothetical protein